MFEEQNVRDGEKDGKQNDERKSEIGEVGKSIEEFVEKSEKIEGLREVGVEKCGDLVE